MYNFCEDPQATSLASPWWPRLSHKRSASVLKLWMLASMNGISALFKKTPQALAIQIWHGISMGPAIERVMALGYSSIDLLRFECLEIGGWKRKVLYVVFPKWWIIEFVFIIANCKMIFVNRPTLLECDDIADTFQGFCVSFTNESPDDSRW